jgi:hypothetical protein
MLAGFLVWGLVVSPIALILFRGSLWSLLLDLPLGVVALGLVGSSLLKLRVENAAS